MEHLYSKEKAIKQSRVLIVDDTATNRMFIHAIFSDAGFINIEEAVDGEDAINKILDFKPDIVLLDVVMPKKDGFQVCTEVQKHHELNEMVIIMQTGMDKPEDKEKAFEVGASDYITKPVNKKEILARSLSHLEKYYMTLDLKAFNNRINEELSSVIALQKEILPSDTLIKEFKEKYKVDISSYYQPCSELGGDFWGIKFISDNKYAIYNVDFAGHGIQSAVNTFRLQTILNDESLYQLEPNKFLEELNNRLFAILPTGQFATMFYGIFNKDEEVLVYSAAACPAPIIISNNSIEMLSGKGTPLGAIKDSKYKNNKINVSKNNKLFLYSDALIETENTNGTFISENDLSILAKELGETTCNSSMAKILQYFRDWTNGSILRDDLTLVLLSFNENKI